MLGSSWAKVSVQAIKFEVEAHFLISNLVVRPVYL